MKINILIKLTFIVFITYLTSALATDKQFIYRPDVQEFINFMASKHHYNKLELKKILANAQLQPQIIESMEAPYEKKNWDIYQQFFITPERIQEGVSFWKNNKTALDKAEKLYNVPANIIVAIIGIETLYGKNQGNYRVIDALTTLAFNYPARAPFFKNELIEYLLLCREHQISPNQYLGSYAGAMGKPQFMPSSYRYYAADFAGHRKKDLMNDNEAVIASVANYFHQHGWSTSQEIAQPAKVVSEKYKIINADNKKAMYDSKQIAQAGIKPLSKLMNTGSKIGLLELSTAKGQEYWLTYPNFYVITRYNTSPQYALAVYLLSQKINQGLNSDLS